MRTELLRRRAQQSGPSLGVELLEPRQLLSVAVTPHRVNGKALNRGGGFMTVAILSEPDVLDASTIDPTTLSVTAEPDGREITLSRTPRIADVNRDGLPDLVTGFRRSQLSGLLADQVRAVDVVLSVQGDIDGSGILTDLGSDTLTIFSPGRPTTRRQSPTDTAGSDTAIVSGPGKSALHRKSLTVTTDSGASTVSGPGKSALHRKALADTTDSDTPIVSGPGKSAMHRKALADTTDTLGGFRPGTK